MSELQFEYATKGMNFYKKTCLFDVVKRVMVNGEHIGELIKEYDVHRSSVHRCLASIKLNLEANCIADRVTMITSIVPENSVKTLNKEESNLLGKIMISPT